MPHQEEADMGETKTVENTPSQPRGPSPKLARMLAEAAPAQREQAIEMASKLLNRRAKREAEALDGKIDLTAPLPKPK
jgi:hypothetical protein